MRDDIHNKAPISAALRGVLQQALRPADRQRPDRLRDSAIKALLKEIGNNFSSETLRTLDKQEPDLFQHAPFTTYPSSRLEADVIDYLQDNPWSSASEACEAALHSYVDSQCNESEATMLAAGGYRNEIRSGIRAFRAALHSAIPAAVQSRVGGVKPKLTNHKVNLSEMLPLGTQARGKKR